MDRIPATTEGARGGGRETAAGSTAGARPGRDRARLTVKPGNDLHGSAEIREIAGQAVRDLEAIRGDARPEDKVFGFNANMGYRHINDAARAAGLTEPGEPSTA